MRSDPQGLLNDNSNLVKKGAEVRQDFEDVEEMAQRLRNRCHMDTMGCIVPLCH